MAAAAAAAAAGVVGVSELRQGWILSEARPETRSRLCRIGRRKGRLVFEGSIGTLSGTSLSMCASASKVWRAEGSWEGGLT